MGELMSSWDTLGTLAGASAAVTTIVQFAKDQLAWFNPKLLALVVAIIVMVAIQMQQGGIDFNNALLTFVHAIVVAITSIGCHSGIVKSIKK